MHSSRCSMKAQGALLNPMFCWMMLQLAKELFGPLDYSVLRDG